jgi:hypothetical protein
MKKSLKDTSRSTRWSEISWRLFEMQSAEMRPLCVTEGGLGRIFGSGLLQTLAEKDGYHGTRGHDDKQAEPIPEYENSQVTED